MKAESLFVLLTAREGAHEEAAKAASGVRSWDLVADLATQHRISSFVLSHLRAAHLPDAASVRSRLQDALLESVARVAALDSELRSVIRILNQAGIAPLALKGPALARNVYPAPHFRPYDDIDVAVQGRDIEEAATALAVAGYRQVGKSSLKGTPVPRFHLQFQGPVGGVVVELHSDVLQLGLPPVCENERWARAMPLVSFEGAMTLAPSDQLVQLAVHAHKHGYCRLIWLKDLDMVARHAERIDWDLVVSTTVWEGLQGPVWYGLALSQELLGTPLPHDLLDRLSPGLPIRALYRCIWPRHRIALLQGRMHRRAVQFETDSMRGMLPSLVLLGRRSDRGRAALEAIQIQRQSAEALTMASRRR